MPDAAHSDTTNGLAALDRTKVMSFQFRNAPWTVVLAQFAAETHLELRMQAVPQGVFNRWDSAVLAQPDAGHLEQRAVAHRLPIEAGRKRAARVRPITGNGGSGANSIRGVVLSVVPASVVRNRSRFRTLLSRAPTV